MDMDFWRKPNYLLDIISMNNFYFSNLKVASNSPNILSIPTIIMYL